MSIRPLFVQHDRSRAANANCPPSNCNGPANESRAKALATVERNQSGAWMMWVVLLAMAFAVLLVSRAAAQQGNFPYDSLPMHPQLEKEAVVKSVEAATKAFATTGSGDPRMANGYFSSYVPAKMTAPDGVKYISELMENTTTLLSRAQRSNRPQVAAQLTKFIFDGMKKVAEGNFHPAARINATLVLSRLDRQPANSANRTPPIPLRETLPILLALYEDENNVDGVRAAALHGLHRHVVYGFPQISQADQTKITTMMTGLLESPAPAGRPAEAHAYLQRFAVDIVDVLRAKGDKSLGTKLISISTDPSNPDLIALYSASRLAAIGPELQGQINAPEKVLDSWSKRVLSAFEGELARLDGMKRQEPARSQPVKPESLLQKAAPKTPTPRSGMGSMEDSEMGMEEMDMDMGDMYSMENMDDMDMDMEMDSNMMMMMGAGMAPEKPQPPEVIASRQKLNYILQQVQLGVTGQAAPGLPTRNPGGLLASLPQNQQKVVEDWVTEIEPVVTALNDKTLDDLKKYREGLVAQIELLREIAGVEEDEAAGADPGLPDELAPVDPLADLGPAAPVAPAPAAPAPAAPAPAAPAPAAATNNVTNDLVAP